MPEVHIDVVDGVATITLDDPPRRNALSTELVRKIADAFDAVEADADVRAVVVTGASPAFCAGADLAHLLELTGDDVADELLGIYEGFLRVWRCPLPTVAAVGGPAVGAGFQLALACDVRVAASTARFDTRFAKLGLHPGGGFTWLLQRVVGAEKAFVTAMFGEVLDGEQAERAGLVWRCVPGGQPDVLEAAQDLAGRAARVPRELATRIKATMRSIPALADIDSAVRAELTEQVWSMEDPEMRALRGSLRRPSGDPAARPTDAGGGDPR